MVEDSLRIWQQNRHRADNISAIVVFLDDEFLPQSSDDEDTESIASSEADTVIITRDDDTPPMSGSENLSSLVRQILPFGGNKTDGSNCSSSTTGVSSSAGDEEGSSTPRNNVGQVTPSGCHQKRKHPLDDTTSLSASSNLPSKCKKAKHHNSTTTTTTIASASPPLNSSEDSHQCTNVITVLSAESLSDLQLDEEDLGFVDEERTRKLSPNRQRLSLVSVPQAAK